MEKKKKKSSYIVSIKDPRFRSFLMSVLRRASRFWKPSDECINKSRVFKGGHTCNICKAIHKRKDMKKDHINPVIPLTGFSSWDNIIERMFIEESGWQAICKDCHEKKTKEENEKRKSFRKENKVVE